MHNVKQASNILMPTQFTRRRISCDVVGVSKLSVRSTTGADSRYQYQWEIFVGLVIDNLQVCKQSG